LELDCLFFPPHTDNIGTPAAILLDKSGQRFYIHVEMYDFGDRDEIGVLHVTDVEKIEAKIIEYIMQNAVPINVDLSGFKIDLIETSINEIVVETGIHLSDSIQAISILPAIMPTQLVVQRVGDAKGIAYDGAKVGPEFSDYRICPRP
jgi:hypothetical protein